MRQDLQAMIQPCQQCLWREHVDACCRQFDGQRKAIQTRAYLSECLCVALMQLELELYSSCPLQKEIQRRVLCEGLHLYGLLAVRHGERRDRELLLGRKMQDLSAGHEQFEVQAGGE